MTRLLTICLALAACSAGDAATIRFMGRTDYRIREVFPVHVSGTKYKANFTHGLSYDDWLSENPLEPTFTSRSDNVSAAFEINAAIFSTNTFLPSNDTTTTRGFGIPFLLFDDGDLRSTFFNVYSIRPLYYRPLFPLGLLTGDLANLPAWAWVSFTVIPEPSSLILLASPLLGVGSSRWHWRR